MLLGDRIYPGNIATIASQCRSHPPTAVEGASTVKHISEAAVSRIISKRRP